MKRVRPTVQSIEYIDDPESGIRWFELWVNAAKNYLIDELSKDRPKQP